MGLRIFDRRSNRQVASWESTEGNPFAWLMVPHTERNISRRDIMRLLNPLRGLDEFGFPQDFPGGFFNRRNWNFLIKVELQWRVTQVAGAIWENNGLCNVFRLLEQRQIPSWRQGRDALLELMREQPQRQRAEIKRNDANRMAAVLLFEFAEGCGRNNETHFTESDAFQRQLNLNDSLLIRSISQFYSEMRASNMTDETRFIQSRATQSIPISLPFSPDHTDTIRQSWEKHIDAWNNNPNMFIVGGMIGTITKNNDKFRVQLRNPMSLSSLALRHLMRNIETPGPFRTTIQTFTFDLTLERFRELRR